MELPKYVQKLLELQPDIDKVKLKIAIEAVSKISGLSIDNVAKIGLFNLLLPDDEKFKGDILEMYREIYRTYENDRTNR